MENKLLQVKNLCVSFSGKQIVRSISFDVGPGETLGIIGESGSGKSVTAFTIAQLLPHNAEVTADSLAFLGQDLLRASPSAINALRGQGWSVIFQDPVGSFNPVKTVEWHFKAVLRRVKFPKGNIWPESVRLLSSMGIPAPERVLKSYPGQLSGGMLQRSLIALVLALKPKLVIADEPTTNLDKVVETQILDLLEEAKRTLGASVILITHDLLVAERVCDRIAVMYRGKLVETGTTKQILTNPSHPYTRALLESSRSLSRGDAHLQEISDEMRESWASGPGQY